jgi:hypothetical protein
MDIHYEIICGRVQLHFEGKFTREEYRPLLRFLRSEVPTSAELKWRRYGDMNQGLCEVDYEVEEWDELTDCLKQLVDTFDSLIQNFIDTNPELFPNKQVKEELPKLTYEIVDVQSDTAPAPEVKPVEKIPFDQLTIPPYQRPYKWTAKNVNQLITDLLAFKNKNQYRLGTLVLNGHEIVDGQQRIVTLALLIKIMYEQVDEKRKPTYKELVDKVECFSKNVQFPNRYSLHNVVENIHVIEARKADFNAELLDFLLKKCEFVVITLNDISEAFQFFDSQNARGKDLAAHDLLKAYHLREIDELSHEDSKNIDEWQTQQTNTLREIFLTMYRSKRWSQGKSARYFTKNDVGAFKGVSLKDGKRYPFYQMEVIAHIFSQMYNNDPVRVVDRQTFEYPFNLDDQVVNGSRFFDMVRHYMALYRQITNLHTFAAYPVAEDIINTINDYEGVGRTGDQYVRSMFNTLLFYYVDRFGMEELDKVVPKFFIWAYTLRLVSPAVQLASTDNYAKEYNSMMRRVHDANTPYDIINISQESIARNAIAGTKCDKIKELFERFNKIYNE